MVFQNPYGSLNPRKKIGAILEAPLEINTRSAPAERAERARAMLAKVGLRPEHYDRYPHMFSGGQRQRIAIARALMLDPALVVADEPVSALDVSVQAQVLNLLADLQHELGLAYLFISHDLAVVRHIAHEVLVMYLGLAMEQGPKERIFARPLHPYTQALLASTPSVCPAQRRAADRADGRAARPRWIRRRAACSRRAARTRSSAAAPSGRRCANSTGGRLSCHLAEKFLWNPAPRRATSSARHPITEGGPHVQAHQPPAGTLARAAPSPRRSRSAALAVATAAGARRWCSAPRAAPRTSIPASTRPAPRSTPTARSTAASSTSSAAAPPSCPAWPRAGTISPDGTVYTFKLRKGVKWHNHRAWKPTRDFNADDIIFLFERQWKEDNPYFKVTSSNHSYFNDMGMPKLLKSVEKVDDYTVRITLNKPEAPFLSNLAMEYAGVQSKEYADAMLKAGTPEKIDQEPIGTGPFYLVQYQKDAIIRYKAFPQFWGGKAKIDDLVFSITPDASVRWAKLQKGECHVMPYPNPADLDAIRKDPNVQVLEQPGLNVGYLAYNTTKKPFDDVRVRKAINMAIDKKAIIDAVYLSAGVAAKNPIPPTQWSYNDAIKDDPYDPAAAKKLLAEAGYPERLPDRPVGDARAASVQPQRQAHRRADPGGPREGRHHRRDQELRVGRVPQAHAGRRAPDGHARLDRRQRRPGQLPRHAARLRVGEGQRQQRRQVLLPAVRGPDPEGEDAVRPEAARRRSTSKAQVIFKEQAPWFTIAHAVQLKPVRKEVIDFKLSPFGRHTFYGVDIKE